VNQFEGNYRVAELTEYKKMAAVLPAAIPLALSQ
jgi:hypothetical protein